MSKGIDYEVSLAGMARRSERRAWYVAFSAVLMSLILAAGYFMLLPLKERTPFLVVNDVYSGVATVARLEGNLGQMTAIEAVTRSNIARYIASRESYDNVQYGMRDRRVVYAMSTPDVAAAYSALYSAQNPDNLISRYGPAKALRVEIISIVPLGGTFGGDPAAESTSTGDAQIRFRRILVDKNNGFSSVLDTKLATLRYQYNKDLRLNDRESVENPLRFQVTSYRVDDEAVTTNVLPAAISEEAEMREEVRRRNEGQSPGHAAGAATGTTAGQSDPSIQNPSPQGAARQ